MTDKPPQTLVDQWTARLKSHPVPAAVVMVALVVGGIASFTDAITKMKAAFLPEPPKPAPVVTVQLPEQKPSVAAPPTPAPPRNKVSFREEFNLRERAPFVSKFAITITPKEIYWDRTAKIQIDGAGEYPISETVQRGSRVELKRSDCENLAVLIRDIQVSWPKEITEQELDKMHPVMQERYITRHLAGIVSGRCEE